MCKKLLAGLLGSGEQSQKTPAAAPTAAVNPNNTATVKDTSADNTSANNGIVTQVTDDRKRKGVPGLNL